MRRLLSATLLLAAASAAGAAESRMFIIANQPDGYGVDRCLSEGAACGKAAATAYCESRSYASVASFRRVERDEITGSLPLQDSCRGRECDAFVAITCQK